MADLLAEGDSSNGNGIPTSRPHIPAPAPTSSPRSNIRGPRMIMQERQEREARRAERERMERAQAEQDARISAEQRRQALERERERERAAMAAAAATAAAAAGTGPASAVPAVGMVPSNVPQQVDPATQRRQQRAERTAAAAAAAAASAGQPSGPPPNIQQPPPPQQMPQQGPQQSQTRPVRIPQGAQAPPQPTGQAPAAAAPAPAGGGQPPLGGTAGAAARGATQAPSQQGPGGDAGAGGTGSRPRNSFPHAFERWEALSAHWEGLTSFWIRQLQHRSEEIDQDPLSRQLARQVTDLSAAGANLFHAVVELQRLRASSERKFQRWFFEMRGDMERNNEVQAMLEAALQEERRGRAEAIREAVENERSNSKTQKQLAEMRKELAISKDEARRAWEELGRREQEERDRVISLQEGLPTIVGGVQVVPMTQGLPMHQRASSTSHGQQPPPPQAPLAPQQQQPPPQPQEQQHASALDQLPSQAQHQYRHEQQQQQQPQYTQAPTSAAGPSGAGGEYYQPPHGYSSEGGADQQPDQQEEEERQYGTPTSLSAPGSAYPPSASHYYSNPAPADYSGQGFAAPGWETMPRHHHPTRLSDVIEEEDERSRTSASQVSRG